MKSTKVGNTIVSLCKEERRPVVCMRKASEKWSCRSIECFGMLLLKKHVLMLQHLLTHYCNNNLYFFGLEMSEETLMSVYRKRGHT